MTDSFYDEIKTLPLDGENDDAPAGFSSGGSAMGRFKKRKVNFDLEFKCTLNISNYLASRINQALGLDLLSVFAL